MRVRQTITWSKCKVDSILEDDMGDRGKKRAEFQTLWSFMEGMKSTIVNRPHSEGDV